MWRFKTHLGKTQIPVTLLGKTGTGRETLAAKAKQMLPFLS